MRVVYNIYVIDGDKLVLETPKNGEIGHNRY